jgi:hypothetical protein
MKTIKISSLFNVDEWKHLLILKLFHIISNRPIEYVHPNRADILLIGPYDILTFKRKLFNIFLRKIRFNNLENATINQYELFKKIFPSLDIYSLKRNYRPLRVFISYENVRYDDLNCDYYITSEIDKNSTNHLRIPFWKELIDWSHLGVVRESTEFIKRFDNYFKIEHLTSPQGQDFLKKDRKICLFSSHLMEPRKSMYYNFSKHFVVDGNGPFFNKKIKNHKSSSFSKKEILKNYAFNLCPENTLYPGYYTEKVPEAFLSHCLPLAWADPNIELDFNKKSFVNLLNYSGDSYLEISNLLKDDHFLKKFTYEPLLLSVPDLNKEINFVKKIINCL